MGITRRDSRYHFDSAIGGVRLRFSLGVTDRKAAQRLESQIMFALADGPKSDKWAELKRVLPPVSYQTLTANRHVKTSPELSDFRREFTSRLDRRVKLGELAERSRDLYDKTAEVFFNKLDELGVRTLDKVTPKMVEEYLVWRKETILARGGNGNGLSTDYTALQSVFNFARESHILEESPLKGHYKPDSDSLDAMPFAQEELDCLEANLTEENRLPYLLLRWTGLRGSDAAAVTWASINWTDKTLRWQTHKRKTWVQVPLVPSLYDELLARKDAAQTPEILGGINRPKLYRTIGELGKRAGVEDCHPHKFRTTLACSLLASGATLFDVGKLLGDSPAVVDKYYAAVTDKQQQRVRGLMESSGQNQDNVVN